MDDRRLEEGTNEVATHHVLSPGHQSLVDDLGGVVTARVYVDALLDHGIRARAQRLTDLIPTRLDGGRRASGVDAVGTHG